MIIKLSLQSSVLTETFDLLMIMRKVDGKTRIGVKLLLHDFV